ncbi:MAG: mannose-6-phosphate isomerase, class I [Saprospiraceae bacterium]
MAIYPLNGKIQHYAWGGKTFLPQLLGVQNTDNQPFAELWMGTHHRGEGILLVDNTPTPLSDFIQEQPTETLGKSVADRFVNRLPFLFKVLSVDKMLSIQSHPTKAQAKKGFAAENAAGVPLTAFHRNFKDDNHKPEVMVALTDFWLLHGFKSKQEITTILNTKAAFAPLRAHFSDANIFNLYKYIMEISQAAVNEILQPLADELAENEYTRDEADYWAKLAFQDYTRENGDYDRGVFSIYLFNLVGLKKGEGIFQGAGIPHAYLEGVNMELMANSDNVFRGGLTPKHVDVPKLLEHLVFDSVTPKILTGKSLSATETVFVTPAPDFELRKLNLFKKINHSNSPEPAPAIVIVMEGVVEVQSGNTLFERKQGEIFFATANTPYSIICESETAILFKATVPIS